jgi:arylesterase/paraoxonase
LYLACSSLEGRRAWLPNGDFLNLEKRPEDDYLAIYDTKGTGSVASRTTKVTPKNFLGTNGKGSYNLHGIGVHLFEGGSEEEKKMRIFLINHRPQPEAEKYGANSTVELFETTLGSGSMQHLKTFADPVIFTPNDITPTGPDSFVFSNDHHVKVGQRKMLDTFFKMSNVAACGKNGCKKVFDPHQYPNGVTGVSSVT